MKRHLLLCGERGVGKSTLIRRLLERNTREIGGFVTKRLPTADENGFFPIYLYPAAQMEECSGEPCRNVRQPLEHPPSRGLRYGWRAADCIRTEEWTHSDGRAGVS